MPHETTQHDPDPGPDDRAPDRRAAPGVQPARAAVRPDLRGRGRGRHRPVRAQHRRRPCRAGLVAFLQVFFAIWWAWMNFTWFASSYDTDDVAYRLLTLVQMAGVLVLAAGVPAAAEHSDYRAVTLGYLIMRIGAGRRNGCGPASRTREPPYRAALRRRHQRHPVRLAATPPPRRDRRVDGRPRSVAASSSWSASSWPCRRGPNGPRPPTGIRTTSPSATACSRSSCSARACPGRRPTPYACARRDPGQHAADHRRGLRGSSCCSPRGGCTSSHPAGAGLEDRRERPTCGDTATTASSPHSPPSAPAWRSPSSRPGTNCTSPRPSWATPSPSPSPCSSGCSGSSTADRGQSSRSSRRRERRDRDHPAAPADHPGHRPDGCARADDRDLRRPGRRRVLARGPQAVRPARVARVDRITSARGTSGGPATQRSNATRKTAIPVSAASAATSGGPLPGCARLR